MYQEYINTDFLDGNITGLGTEQTNPDTINIADVSTLEVCQMINNEDKTVPEKVEEVLPQIAKAADMIVERMGNGGRLIYMGAGTSGRLGVVDASECPPTYFVPYDRVICLMAGGNERVFKAAEELEDSEELAVKTLKEFGLKPEDTVVAAAVSGRTPYCVGGLNYAKSIGAGAVAISCNKDSVMGAASEIPIEVDTGAEAVMGSTRMKGGLAVKMIMHTLTTTIFVRMGRTYKNLILEPKAGNSKSYNRDLRIIADALGNPDLLYAKELFEKAHNNPRVAVIMELTGADFETTNRACKEGDGNIRLSIELAKKYKEENNK